MGKMYGYARVSTRDQNLDGQIDALIGFGVGRELISPDKASGNDFERSEYQRLRSTLCEGDVIMIKSIDRLGRDYREILEQWQAITKGDKVAVLVLDTPLLDTKEEYAGITNILILDIVLQLLSYVVQVEREHQTTTSRGHCRS